MNFLMIILQNLSGQISAIIIVSDKFASVFQAGRAGGHSGSLSILGSVENSMENKLGFHGKFHTAIFQVTH